MFVDGIHGVHIVKQLGTILQNLLENSFTFGFLLGPSLHFGVLLCRGRRCCVRLRRKLTARWHVVYEYEKVLRRLSTIEYMSIGLSEEMYNDVIEHSRIPQKDRKRTRLNS